MKDLHNAGHRGKKQILERAMADIQSHFSTSQRRRMNTILLNALIAVYAVLPLAARQQGPAGSSPASAKTQSGPMSAGPQNASLGPPSIPADQIIQQFAAKEGEFRTERDNFTYTQTFVVQTLDESNRVDGEYKLVSDIVFDGKGKRIEVVTNAPAPTLERLMLTQEDFNDLEHLYPFVLTTEDLPKYDIKYVDHIQLDELATYVFDVAPKTIEKNQRYFEGRIWVDDKDFQIVKTFGKAVGYAKKRRGDNEQLFPRFETFRENIEGKYWFPTYTRADEVLPFRDNPVHMRVTVRYENYKRFGVTVKIGAPVKAEPDPKKK
jgi:hypothetical protein